MADDDDDEFDEEEDSLETDWLDRLDDELLDSFSVDAVAVRNRIEQK